MIPWEWRGEGSTLNYFYFILFYFLKKVAFLQGQTSMMKKVRANSNSPYCPSKTLGFVEATAFSLCGHFRFTFHLKT